MQPNCSLIIMVNQCIYEHCQDATTISRAGIGLALCSATNLFDNFI